MSGGEEGGVASWVSLFNSDESTEALRHHIVSPSIQPTRDSVGGEGNAFGAYMLLLHSHMKLRVLEKPRFIPIE